MTTQKGQSQKKISQGSQESHLGNLRILLEIQPRGPWVQDYLFENTTKKLLHLSPKSCRNFTQWFREGRSWSIAVTQLRSVSRLHANTSSPDVYCRKRPNRRAHLELCHRNLDILGRVLNQIALSNSTAEKCAPMQGIKQPEHGRTSTTEEQK